MEKPTSKTKSLIEEIKYYNAAYRMGCEIVSDEEYDQMVEELRVIDPDNDWFKRIEPATISESRKSKLPFNMRSLDKEKTIEGLKKWFKKRGLSDQHVVVIMPKYDGISILVDENKGSCWTRGGSENEGMICDEHYLRMGAINCDSIFSHTFGEAIISRFRWNEYFDGKANPRSGEVYKSPRNTVSGIFAQDEPPQSIQHVSLVRYGGFGSKKNYCKFSDLLDDLNECAFPPAKYTKMKIGNICQESLNHFYDIYKEDYKIDGLVIYIDDMDIQEQIGRNQSTGNPQYAIAYKGGFENSAETVITGIDWKVSKAGFLKPVIQIQPVELSDATISNVSGYNASYISDNAISAGAIIEIKRSGEVIPKITRVVQESNIHDFNDMWDELTSCPICGSATKWNKNHVELMCVNPNCSGIRLAKVKHFFNVVGCDEIGDETFNILFANGYDTLKSILDLTYNQIIAISGLGDSMARTIIGNNDRIKHGIDLPVMMHASDCFEGIGQEKSKAILESIGMEEINRIFYTFPKLVIVNNSSITLSNFYNGLIKFWDFLEVNGLKLNEYAVKEKQVLGCECSGMSVCFSGVRDAALEEQIKSQGGQIVSGVSKKTTALIVVDKNANSSKIIKAKELGINLYNIDEFKQNMNY